MTHASDCATNNMPAIPAGPCDCGYLVTVRREDLHSWAMMAEAYKDIPITIIETVEFEKAVSARITAMEAAAR